jgi:hypothetical protein
MTPREGDSSNIPCYSRNLLVAMAPRLNGFDFPVFDFIWGEIKAISEIILKSYGYTPYIIHMIVRVMSQTFVYDKEHHPLWIKNALRAPMEDRRVAAPRASPPRAAREREGSKEISLHLLFRRFLACSLGSASPNTPLM